MSMTDRSLGLSLKDGRFFVHTSNETVVECVSWSSNAASISLGHGTDVPFVFRVTPSTESAPAKLSLSALNAPSQVALTYDTSGNVSCYNMRTIQNGTQHSDTITPRIEISAGTWRIGMKLTWKGNDDTNVVLLETTAWGHTTAAEAADVRLYQRTVQWMNLYDGGSGGCTESIATVHADKSLLPTAAVSAAGVSNISVNSAHLFVTLTTPVPLWTQFKCTMNFPETVAFTNESWVEQVL